MALEERATVLRIAKALRTKTIDVFATTVNNDEEIITLTMIIAIVTHDDNDDSKI